MRQILTILLPLLLPFIGYAIYVKFARQRQGQGASPDGQETPWIWILAIGCVLMTVSLLFYEQQISYPPGAELTAPEWVDGEIVPSHTIDGGAAGQ